MILTSGLNAGKSRRGVATQKTDILNSTHWSLRKSLIPKIDNMSKLGYPSKKSQKLRYFERKEVIVAFTRDPHAMAAMSKWCETETNTSVHCGRSTHTTWSSREPVLQKHKPCEALHHGGGPRFPTRIRCLGNTCLTTRRGTSYGAAEQWSLPWYTGERWGKIRDTKYPVAPEDTQITREIERLCC